MANATIQELPLSDKLTPAQAAKRQNRIAARRTVAEQLASHANITRAMTIQGFQLVRVRVQWLTIGIVLFGLAQVAFNYYIATR